MRSMLQHKLTALSEADSNTAGGSGCPERRGWGGALAGCSTIPREKPSFSVLTPAPSEGLWSSPLPPGTPHLLGI